MVVMRRIDGVRGTVEGELRGFDRHMNVVLGDAQEVFILPTAMKEKKEEEVGGGGGGRKGGEEGGEKVVATEEGEEGREEA